MLELQELLDSPLLGAGGDKMKQTPRKMPEQYEQWLDAQLYSQQASNTYTNFKDLIFPLNRTEDKTVLEDMWKLVNQVHPAVHLSVIWYPDMMAAERLELQEHFKYVYRYSLAAR